MQLHQFKINNAITYILLQGSAPYCHDGSHKTFHVDTNISDSTNSNTK